MPPRRPDLHALTGLRFVAAVAVVVVHLRGHLAALLPATARVDPALSAGFLGVDLFFVLSGFILGYHYLDAFPRVGPRAYGAFLRHRLARIYPLHLATLGLLALFVGFMGVTGRGLDDPQAYGLRDLAANLLLTQCWTFGECAITWNGPAWSLSAEWFAYLCFPALAMVVRRLRRGGPLLLALAVTVAAQLAITELAGLEGGLSRIVATFTMGVLLARLHLAGVPRLRWDAVALWAAGAATVVAMGLATAGRSPAPVIPLFGLLVLALANSPDGTLAGLLGSTRMRFWGQVSYGLYLTHALVLTVGAAFIRLEIVAAAGLPVRLGLLVGYVVAMLVVAAAAYTEIETPWRRLLRGRRLVPAPLAAAAQQLAQSTPMS